MDAVLLVRSTPNTRPPKAGAWPQRLAAVLLLLACCTGSGCHWCHLPHLALNRQGQQYGCTLVPFDRSQWVSKERLPRAYTLVLPGILGSDPWDHSIVQGLKDAEVDSAIEMYDWTMGPFLLPVNLRALARNRVEGEKVAQKIIAYQDEYPDRPVHLIGYSGGAGVAVFALESLPPDRKVSTAVLIAPTLAPDYDLQLAMSRTEHGIRNFYSPIDVPFLMAMTAAVGTSEGRHTFAAGAVGFRTPDSLDPDRREPYAAHLVQRGYTLDLVRFWHFGGHFGWSSRPVVANLIAPNLAGAAASDPPVAADAEEAPALAKASVPIVR